MVTATEVDGAPARSTIRRVATELGVSTATVSRVLNENAHVSPDTRALVLEAVQRHGLKARRPKQVRSEAGAVCVRCPYALDEYFGTILSSLVSSLRQAGKGVLLSAAAKDGDEPGFSDLLAPGTTEGALLILPPEPSAMLVDLRDKGFPFVVIDPRTPLPPDIPAVSAAHMAGSRMATEYLINLGHRRIAAIAGPLNWIATDGRLLGYRAALASAGQLAPDELVSVAGEPTIAHGLTAARGLLAVSRPPTAIVAFNDKIAIGAMQAAKEAGLRVPEDLSVVGFDDLELSRVVEPRLTTVRQPLEEMARIGVDLLLRLMSGRDINRLHIELATQLVVRSSAARPVR